MPVKKKVHFKSSVVYKDMVLKQNFSLYFPIQLWRATDGRVRLQPPVLLTSDNEKYTFRETFWPESVDEKEKLRTTWVFETTFWGFHPKYFMELSRGFVTLVASQNTIFPFETKTVDVYDLSTDIFQDETSFLGSFGFIAYAYPVPGTVLLSFHTNGTREHLLQRTVLCPLDQGCPVDHTEYSELPSRGQTVPYYDVGVSGVSISVYVFTQKPLGQYFQMNGEGLCLPSSNPRDFSSIRECMHASLENKVLWYRAFTQTNNKDLQQIMLTYPISRLHPALRAWIALVLCGLVLIIISLRIVL